MSDIVTAPTAADEAGTCQEQNVADDSQTPAPCTCNDTYDSTTAEEEEEEAQQTETCPPPTPPPTGAQPCVTPPLSDSECACQSAVMSECNVCPDDC